MQVKARSHITKISIFVIFFLLVGKNVFAQDLAGGMATEVPLSEEVVAGDVICSSDNLFKRCAQEYQTSLYGVVVDSSALEISGTGIQDSRLVATSGIATVRVSNLNGEVKKGNLVTSSGILGVAQLADKNGYVLGTALEDLTNSSESVGQIQVLINIHPATGISKGTSSNLLRFIREGLTVPVFEPLESFRYLLAAIMVIVSFGLGLLYFGRSSKAGIEAVGRNPLAKRVIQMTILLNILLTIVIVCIGLAIAYLILVM